MRPTIALLVALFTGTAVADEFDPKKPLICSIGNLSECTATKCEPVTNDSINAPSFLRINVKKETIQSIAGGQGRTTALESIEVTDDQILMSAAQPGNDRLPQGFSYAIVISIQTGHLTFAVAGDELAFTGFGACMVDS